MARDYYRPELSVNDLKLILAGRVVAINPNQADIARCIETAEKRCRKNKLNVSEAEAAWQLVSTGESLVAAVGDWKCPDRRSGSNSPQYDIQGTVVVIVRISDSLIGMSCERQTILAGTRSETSLLGFDPVRVERQPIQWFNHIAELFWTHLSEDEIADLKQQASINYLSTLTNGFPKAWEQKRIANLKALQGLQDPVNITELQAAGKRIAAELQLSGRKSILWRDLKQREPALSARYQRELLEILHCGSLSCTDLENLPDHLPFRLRFSVWRGAQRIFQVPQLVLEIEAYDLLQELRRGDKEQRKVADLIIGTAGWKWHPGESNCVGWIRVHIDDENELCFIDEVQSDTVEELTSYLHAQTDRLSGREIACIQDYLRSVKQWHVHGMSCLMQWVTEIDYELSIHSRESATNKGMTPSDRKWNTYYGALIRRYSLQLQVIDGYPAPIWVASKANEKLPAKKVS